MRDTGFSGDQLLAMYDRVAGAEDAIPRLRRFVLDLAVRGKLVAQDAADEPASELLKRIESEKARLVKAGEIRKPRDLANGDETENPFEIPASWRWCRIDSVGAIIGGGTPPSGNPENFAEPGQGIPWLTPADLGGYRELFIERGMRDLTEKGLASSSATKMPAGTVLFTSRAPIGYVAIAANPISTNQGFKSIVPYVSECSRFIALVMQTFAPEIDAKAPGTTFKEVSGKIVAGVRFPLPPLAEQRRIVAKVAELMGLLDQLEQTRARAEGVRARLTTATWARLTTDAADAPQSARHTDFALKTLPALTTTPTQIKALRQTILNLALRGKLVAQDPNDEPVSKSLAAISMKREGMIRNRELRRDKPFAPVQVQDAPFQIPSTWVWVRVGELALFTQYGTSAKAAPSETGIPVLTMGNIQDGLVVRTNEKRISENSDELPGLFLKNMDLLYNRTNSAELVGKTGLYRGDDDSLTFASYLIRIRLSVEETSPIYINIAMNAPDFRETQIVPHIKKQTGQANVSGSALKNMLIPLAPLAEQHRIVAKVDALMELCDQLETALTTTATTRARLLETLIRRALSPDDPIPQAAE